MVELNLRLKSSCLKTPFNHHLMLKTVVFWVQLFQQTRLVIPIACLQLLIWETLLLLIMKLINKSICSHYLKYIPLMTVASTLTHDPDQDQRVKAKVDIKHTFPPSQNCQLWIRLWRILPLGPNLISLLSWLKLFRNKSNFWKRKTYN